MRKKLIGLRKDRHLNQAQLARELGLTQSMISKLERGKTNPGFQLQKKLSVFFNVGIEELFFTASFEEVNE